MLKVTIPIVLVAIVVFSSERCMTKDATEANTRTVVPLTTPTPPSSDLFVNPSGWRIPRMDEKPYAESNTELKGHGEGQVPVTAKDYLLESEITDEPFRSLGKLQFGTIKVVEVREYCVSERCFAYLLRAKLWRFSESENEFRARGPAFTYLLIDSDGDGTFDTLSSTPQKHLIVPAWLLGS